MGMGGKQPPYICFENNGGLNINILIDRTIENAVRHALLGFDRQ
jgi:hypothetical protein